MVGVLHSGRAEICLLSSVDQGLMVRVLLNSIHGFPVKDLHSGIYSPENGLATLSIIVLWWDVEELNCERYHTFWCFKSNELHNIDSSIDTGFLLIGTFPLLFRWYFPFKGGGGWGGDSDISQDWLKSFPRRRLFGLLFLCSKFQFPFCSIEIGIFPHLHLHENFQSLLSCSTGIG